MNRSSQCSLQAPRRITFALFLPCSVRYSIIVSGNWQPKNESDSAGGLERIMLNRFIIAYMSGDSVILVFTLPDIPVPSSPGPDAFNPPHDAKTREAMFTRLRGFTWVSRGEAKAGPCDGTVRFIPPPGCN